jgi:hypothetical protein
LDVHSVSVAVSLQPNPLHEFCPLQELCAVLQALVPLHEFPPPHLIFAGADTTDPALAAANRIAAEAMSRRFLVMSNSLETVFMLQRSKHEPSGVSGEGERDQ